MTPNTSKCNHLTSLRW